MCAEVDVCFMPDSLGDYQDAFTVETPAGRFDVQLTGQRPHPVLTLPPVLEVSLVPAYPWPEWAAQQYQLHEIVPAAFCAKFLCGMFMQLLLAAGSSALAYDAGCCCLLLLHQVGNVLVGNQRSRTFEFVNSGGDARFLVLTAQQWAATLQEHGYQQNEPFLLTQPDPAGGADNIQLGAAPHSSAAYAAAAAAQVHTADGFGAPEVADTGPVTAGPFSVGPAYLDLPAGAAGVLTVEFSPEQQGPQAAEFVLVCDNCTAHPLRVEGVGEQVQVQLVGLDDRPWLPQDAQMPLWFGQVSKVAVQLRTLRFANNALAEETHSLVNMAYAMGLATHASVVCLCAAGIAWTAGLSWSQQHETAAHSQLHRLALPFPVDRERPSANSRHPGPPACCLCSQPCSRCPAG
jgi:hypothetical protein